MRPVERVDCVVVGAGHAGLAVSRLLTEARHDHVVLDRGRIGERWRTERWDSLHLLTPNWMTRLPRWEYAGPAPDGYLSASAFVHHLEHYAASFAAPVIGGTTVVSVREHRFGGYVVVTDRGTWQARRVVVATGPHGAPVVPGKLAGGADVEVLHSSRYRNPRQLAPGGVLVVGASASGVQIADELARAGRQVVVAVGRHTRMPRRYRGRDIFGWLEGTGRLARTIDEVSDPVAARAEPSLQLVGRSGHHDMIADLDLPALHAGGVRLTGRLASIVGGVAIFVDDLDRTVSASEGRMHRFLDRVDRYVEQCGLAARAGHPLRPEPFTAPAHERRLHLGVEGIRTILLATGYRPDHSWLQVPLTRQRGVIRQYRGTTQAPGLYVVGQRFQHRRDSGFVDGARHDARAVVTHLLTGVLPADADAGRVA
ncbi:putative Monooxygenase [metagenome]|uniref:Putative Monooxygenase n=1 Tax=metagenome TaxID=256318 RepID=A0A2P2C3N4_9ZZZZ